MNVVDGRSLCGPRHREPEFEKDIVHEIYIAHGRKG